MLLFWLVLGSTMLLSGSQEQAAPKKTAPQADHSLIRKDLLVTSDQPLELPERNIFKPDRRRNTAEVPEDTGPIVPPEEEITEAADTEEDLVAGWTGQLRYIGYIGSQRRTVALIIFNGQALAVEEGEQIADDLTVTKISRQEVEFEGPGSIQIKAAFEGEI